MKVTTTDHRDGKHYRLEGDQWMEYTPPPETTQATIADAAIRILEVAHPWWVEEGTWMIWEHPDRHPGGVTIQACISGGAERDTETRAWGAAILEAAGWRTEIIPPTADGHSPYVLAYPPVIVVTRHTALVDYLREAGHIGADVEIVPHVDTLEQVRGKHVIGILPLHLAVETAALTEVALQLPPAAYGREWTLDELRPAVQGMRQYQIRSGPAPRKGYDIITCPYPAALEWLQARYPGIPTAPVYLTATDVTEKNVMTLSGLPLHLGALASTVTAQVLDIPFERRGTPLSAAELDNYYQGTVTARIKG